jgi:hypothetical protein
VRRPCIRDSGVGEMRLFAEQELRTFESGSAVIGLLAVM